MVNAQQIREHMPVVCSKGDQLGMVDRVDGNSIKLTKDDQEQHHWIPMDWVSRVDEHVHLDRSGDDVKREWSTNPPNQDESMGGQEQSDVIAL